MLCIELYCVCNITAAVSLLSGGFLVSSEADAIVFSLVLNLRVACYCIHMSNICVML
jgi:hypothetical protein